MPEATPSGPGGGDGPHERNRAGGVPGTGETSGRAVPGEHATVERALARLPELCRQVIDLHHRRHLSFADIAPLIGRSPEAVRALWARAVETLQRELGQS